jgi:alkyl sulfatase BDS1-like metallo-beta-lactamase superfamily hydrolase
MADAFEQLGYQEENALLRNWYLTTAKELRSDEPIPQLLNSSGKDVVTGIPSNLMLDYISTRIDPKKAIDNSFNINLNGETYLVDIYNGIMNYIKNDNQSIPKAESTIEANNYLLFLILAKQKTAKELLDNNLIKITGSKDSYLNFINSIDLDSSINFNLVKRA